MLRIWNSRRSSKPYADQKWIHIHFYCTHVKLVMWMWLLAISNRAHRGPQPWRNREPWPHTPTYVHSSTFWIACCHIFANGKNQTKHVQHFVRVGLLSQIQVKCATQQNLWSNTGNDTLDRWSPLIDSLTNSFYHHCWTITHAPKC